METYESHEALETHCAMTVYAPGRKVQLDLWDGQPTQEVLDALDLGEFPDAV